MSLPNLVLHLSATASASSPRGFPFRNSSHRIASAPSQMKLLTILLLCLSFPSLFQAEDLPDSSLSQADDLSHPSPSRGDLDSSIQLPRRSILFVPEKKDDALVVTLDGTVSLVDVHQKKVVWSFCSGSPIYSSYQASIKQEDYDGGNVSGLSSSFYLDYGDDWELYTHYRLLGGKRNFMIPIEDIITTTPQIFEDGGVMLGSKKTTVFLVDSRSGRLMDSFKSSDDENIGFYDKNIKEWTVLSPAKSFPLYITRKDYSLRGFAPKSGKVLWNVTVAVLEAASFCQDTSDAFDGSHLLSGYHDNMPLMCHSKALVHRLRGDDLSEFFSSPRLPNPNHTPVHMLPLHTKVNGLLDAHYKLLLPMPPSKLMLPSLPKLDELPDSPPVVSSSALTPFSQPNLNAGLPLSSQSSVKYKFSKGFLDLSYLFVFASFVLMILARLVSYGYALVVKKESHLKQQPGTSLDGRKSPTKKKRNRKSGKSNSDVEQKEDDKCENMEIDNHALLNHNKLLDGVVDGRRVGKLVVSNKEIAKGSNGTIVLQGNYDGRSVAVKRLLLAHHDVAFKEIQNLIASDQHPNIVRWFGVEYDHDFVYLSLERCTCSLNDLILAFSDFSQNSVLAKAQSTTLMIEYRVRLDFIRNSMQDIKLWKANGRPTPLLLKLMRDVVSGLTHLHDLGIIHRDLKPQNVLINKERFLCAKLSDMGISKRLPEDVSSLGLHATGSGSSGWQAPEQLRHARQTRAVDIFSLGCVLFFCMSGGRHPFGDPLERDINIIRNQADLFLVDSVPEAVDLFARSLDPGPDLRPKAEEVLCHPVFWGSEKRLLFLVKTSDRVEKDVKESSVSVLLQALESTAPVALGGNWDTSMEAEFINDLGRYRRYRFDSVRDLLRVMRNKYNHYRELPCRIQGILGSLPEGFDDYFGIRFPKLLIEVYKVVDRHCRGEEWFQGYIERNDY